jgi:Secretion system C-terminal sorting domain
LVSVKVEKDKAYLAMKSVETSEEKVELKYEAITPQLLKEKLKTLDKYQIKLFPNPTSDVLNIQVNTTFSKIQVVNMSGQVVLEEKNLGKSEHQINVSQLPNNIYNIRVFEGEILRGVERAVVNH